MTGAERVLRVLSDGRPHSHSELYALGVIAHSRISDLRRRGHTIECWRDGDQHYYQLVSSANGLPNPGEASSGLQHNRTGDDGSFADHTTASPAVRMAASGRDAHMAGTTTTPSSVVPSSSQLAIFGGMT